MLYGAQIHQDPCANLGGSVHCTTSHLFANPPVLSLARQCTGVHSMGQGFRGKHAGDRQSERLVSPVWTMSPLPAWPKAACRRASEVAASSGCPIASWASSVSCTCTVPSGDPCTCTAILYSVCFHTQIFHSQYAVMPVQLCRRSAACEVTLGTKDCAS